MPKTVYKFFLCVSICLALSHAQAATNSKVRLAVSLSARAIKATALTAKAHPWLSLAAISTTAAAVAVQSEHSKYRRAENALAKSMNKAKNKYKAGYIKKSTHLTKDIGERIAKLQAELKNNRDEYSAVAAQIEREKKAKTALSEEQLRLDVRINQLKDKADPEAQAEAEKLQGELDALNKRVIEMQSDLDTLFERQIHLGTRKRELEELEAKLSRYMSDEFTKIQKETDDYLAQEQVNTQALAHQA